MNKIGKYLSVERTRKKGDAVKAANAPLKDGDDICEHIRRFLDSGQTLGNGHSNQPGSARGHALTVCRRASRISVAQSSRATISRRQRHYASKSSRKTMPEKAHAIRTRDKMR